MPPICGQGKGGQFFGFLTFLEKAAIFQLHQNFAVRKELSLIHLALVLLRPQILLKPSLSISWTEETWRSSADLLAFW